MHPILFQVGQVTFFTYGFTMMAILFLLYFLASRQIDGVEITEKRLGHISFMVVFSIWFGGAFWLLGRHLLGSVTGSGLEGGGGSGLPGLLDPQNLQTAETFPIVALFGFLLILYCRWQHLSFIRVLAFLLPYFILGYGLQRLFGCFSAGCCYGTPTDVMWAVRFPDTLGVGPLPGLAVHPTQLYMAVGALVAYGFMAFSPFRHRGPEAILGMALVGLFGPYFLTTFFRGDVRPETTFYWGLSPRQIISLVGFMIGSGFLVRVWRRGACAEP
ncbi:MAG: prolipoprotein diacylglyceryl transferase [Magnetococcales bacterium]|nr:prolipoprotein diacylglyceryl transferase [Magnetococcales bacterium]